MCAADSHDAGIPDIMDEHFVQFMANNVNHNLRTLDAFDTFHYMAIIVSVSPGLKQHRAIPRSAANLKDIPAKGKINICVAKPLLYEKQYAVDCIDQTKKIDLLLLWKMADLCDHQGPGGQE